MTSWLGAVERTVTGLGYDLVDAERSVGGLLRVTIDRPYLPPAEGSQPFITVEDCERVTRQLQHVLEVEGCAYERLEVSSPGVDRPLKKPADYLRFSGEMVEVVLKERFEGRKKYRGELQAAGEGWRLLLADPSTPAAGEGPKAQANGKTRRGAVPKVPAAEAPRQALDFSLDEVRDARLVPVLDFKGRRFAAPQVDPGTAAIPDDEMDGGRTP